MPNIWTAKKNQHKAKTKVANEKNITSSGLFAVCIDAPRPAQCMHTAKNVIFNI